MRGSSAGAVPVVGRGMFLQQAKALAGGAEGVTAPGLQRSHLQAPNSLIPAPLVIANVCGNVLKFSLAEFGLKYSRMSHPLAFGLLPAILQCVDPAASFRRAML